MERIISEEYAGMLLREYLQDVLKFSRRIIKSLTSESGYILVNGLPQTVRYRLQLHDVLVIKFPPEHRGEFMEAENIPLSIIYEDQDILIIDKAAHMPTVPSRLHPSGTVANGLLYYYKEKNIPYTVHVVTRLDRDTSGLVLIAKHRYSHSLFAKLQQENGIERTYYAFVQGKLTIKQGTIDAPIGRHPDSIIERMVTETGKRAVTHFRVIEIYEDFSSVEVRLETGRTHQIRVHFAHLGHPLIGDDLYGVPSPKIARQALHCNRLGFKHPFTNKRLSFVSPLPEDMSKLLL